MDKFISTALRLVAIFGLAAIGLNILNWKLINKPGALPQMIYDFDIINKAFMHTNIIDMTDIVRQTGGKKKRIEHIIVHHDAYPYGENSWDKVNELHKDKRWGGISYHYFISKSGRIYKNHPDSALTIHAGTDKANAVSIAVCIQGNFNKQTLQGKQKKSLMYVLHKLKNKYPKARILTHKYFKSTSCPGDNISIKELIITSWKPHINHFKNDSSSLSL